ncbi:MAG TPA: hypothetical protein PL155_08065 [Candidatus Omnitrophota bacterium]|nr:hypothetical protein [Candidatus Omnitrophota bacterium]HPD85214.1 hypothetical protein [Candidatus Omnitrophota bacterium]HRZ04285.1 hypothetical protein [Candidatus Omnitrophota bacterium]
MTKRIAALIFLTASLCIFTCACTLYQIDFESTSDNYYPAKTSANEVVYLETVNRPYEVIGTVTVNAERNQKLDNVVDKLKLEAAILGGDAITNIQTNAGTGKWAKTKPKKIFGNANVRTNFVAQVIAFKDVQAGPKAK